MEPRHTPVPWRVETETATPMVIGLDGWPILISGGVRQIGISYDENRKRHIADVRLAAAAPDMLAALKHARSQMRHPDEMIDAAIAKAEDLP